MTREAECASHLHSHVGICQRAGYQNGRLDGAEDARTEVRRAVEEWFSNVSLDDLFAVKGW